VRGLDAQAAAAVALESYEVRSPGGHRPSLFDIAVDLWIFYDEACEAHDRRVCTGLNFSARTPVAWPQTTSEDRLVQRNAAFEYKKLLLRAERLKIPHSTLAKAKRSARRWQADELRGYGRSLKDRA